MHSAYVTALLVGLAGPALAQGTAPDAGAPKPPVAAPATTFEVYGPGNLSCASYLTDRSSRINADGWLLGFWTGLNIGNASGSQVGKTLNGRGIVDQIAAVCRVRPAEPLYKSAQQVFSELKSDGR